MKKFLAVALLLAGCGSAPSLAPPTGTTTPSMPKCADVLTDTIRADYTGACVKADGRLDVNALWNCYDGRRLLANEQMFGFVGEALHQTADIADDPGYKVAYAACTKSS